ncbi:hypothetical protein [Oceanirhabdus sp. W0125-5]|uniref:hypothetical protein n=1 Tax=Oceanirhabdus sp. W0125-5 TaxID=2999116 RepID=UPI0022F34870|nr:hypothetical protein [Oceanirhabdus sp. W0125-5]WBW97315.1 hypothetical protein OW730_00235 [Oceanirhabdus sp. W0125-5]
MNKNLSNKSLIDFINSELKALLKKEQLNGVLVLSIFFGLPLIVLEQKITIMNIFIVGSVLFNLIMYIILICDIRRHIKIYFIYMGISSIILPIILFYDTYRLLMLYEQNTSLYLIILMLVSVSGYIFHFKMYKNKIGKRKGQNINLKDYAPLYACMGAMGMGLARILFRGVSQKNAYIILASMMIIMLFILILNIRYLMMYYLLRKNNIEFQELKVDLTDTKLK